MAIRNGLVCEVGSRTRLLRQRKRETHVIDLGDAVLTPGLVDAHTHFFYWALQRQLVVDLSATTSLQQALDRLSREAPRKQVRGWVIGMGFDQNRWGHDFPHARDLDRAVPDTPAIVRSRDVHSAWLNTAALRKLGLTRNVQDMPGGRYLRDGSGELTGILQDAAMEALPNPERELALSTDARDWRIVDRALQAAYAEAWRYGITGVHSMDDGPSWSHLQRQHAAGKLGLRVLHAVQCADLEHACRLGLRSGAGDDWLRIGGLKIFSDGALGSQTAYMHDDYPGRPGYCGVPVIAGEQLNEIVARAAEHGWAVWVHAIGDRAVQETVAAITAAGPARGTNLPHRVEHAQCVRPADVRRMAKAGIIASVQPCHILGDIITADRHWPRARRWTYPFRSLLEAGVTLAGGSDVPVESLDPRRSLHGAVCRTDEAGQPDAGWFPTERIGVREALEAFTIGAARSAGLPAPHGTLAPGAPADVTIWDEDPLHTAPERLLGLGIRGCMIAGNLHI